MESEFEQFQRDQFSDALDFDYDGPTRKTLVIASTPRSGSHMLGHVLHSTGLFGHPLEYMHGGHIEQWKKQLASGDAAEALQALMRKRTSPNGVFSIKLHFKHFALLGGMGVLRDVFPSPHVVLLSRRDAVKQAVSFAIAEQTGRWIGDAPDESKLTYRYSQIERAYASVIRDTADWRYEVSRTDLPQLELMNEDVVRDVPGAVRSIAGLLGEAVPEELIPGQPVTRRQSSALNAQWAKRFREEAADVQTLGIPREHERDQKEQTPVAPPAASDPSSSRGVRRLARRVLGRK